MISLIPKKDKTLMRFLYKNIKNLSLELNGNVSYKETLSVYTPSWEYNNFIQVRIDYEQYYKMTMSIRPETKCLLTQNQ